MRLAMLPRIWVLGLVPALLLTCLACETDTSQGGSAQDLATSTRPETTVALDSIKEWTDVSLAKTGLVCQLPSLSQPDPLTQTYGAAVLEQVTARQANQQFILMHYAFPEGVLQELGERWKELMTNSIEELLRKDAINLGEAAADTLAGWPAIARPLEAGARGAGQLKMARQNNVIIMALYTANEDAYLADIGNTFFTSIQWETAL